MTPKLDQRVAMALERLRNGQAPMRIPAEPSDPDLVIVALRDEVDRLRAALTQALGQLEDFEGMRPDTDAVVETLRASLGIEQGP